MCFSCNRTFSLSNQDSSVLSASPVADKKGPEGKRTKTKNECEASAKVENSGLQETSEASEDCGKNLSRYWLMKSEPESRLEKGVDVKVRSHLSPKCMGDMAVSCHPLLVFKG